MFSIIIPVQNDLKIINQKLKPILKQQTCQDFELIIVADEKNPTTPGVVVKKGGPAEKRDFGATRAKGEILVFLDSDAYPTDSHYLQNALKLFANESIAAICGPNLTPPDSPWQEQVSGLVWSSWLGAGGAGVFRNSIQSSRFVDDYPTSNFIIRKRDFDIIGGFNTTFWPGEDTKLCLDIITKLGKKILYHPTLSVYHHRRPIYIPHLRQIARFGFHRGLFCKIYPQTSRKIGYFIPSLFTLQLILLPFISLTLWMVTNSIYVLLILVTIRHHPSAILIFPLTHLTYGICFVIGLFKKKPTITTFDRPH